MIDFHFSLFGIADWRIEFDSNAWALTPYEFVRNKFR